MRVSEPITLVVRDAKGRAEALGTWDGMPMDYGWAVDIMLRQEERYGGEDAGAG